MSFLKENDSSISKFSKEVRELSRSVLCRGWTGFPKIIKKVLESSHCEAC